MTKIGTFENKAQILSLKNKCLFFGVFFFFSRNFFQSIFFSHHHVSYIESL
jgi:hypothetical protein